MKENGAYIAPKARESYDPYLSGCGWTALNAHERAVRYHQCGDCRPEQSHTLEDLCWIKEEGPCIYLIRISRRLQTLS